MQVHCPGGGEDGDPAIDVTVVDHVKLFRNRPDLRFDGRIHEQILPAIRRAGGEVAWTDLYVVHSGSDQSPAAQAEEARARPADARARAGRAARASVHAVQPGDDPRPRLRGSPRRPTTSAAASRRPSPDESHLRKAYALLVYAEMRLGRRDGGAGSLPAGPGVVPARRRAAVPRGGAAARAGPARRGAGGPTLDVLDRRRGPAFLQRRSSA